jgi:hyperpolarization activated cyclic nucleotide-gated potassium channel 1
LWHYIATLEVDPDSWVVRNKLENKSNFTRYIASIYYAFTALTTVGYGDIHAKTAGINPLRNES